MIGSSVFGAFFDECAEAHDIFEGIQLTAEELQDYDDDGLVPYISNQIAPRILNVTGKEVTTRTRLKFTPRVVSEEAEKQAQILTKLVMWLQENNQSPTKWSNAMLKARISGLAWHHLLPVNDTIREEILNSLDVIWDPEDRTMDMSDSRGQGFIRWTTRDRLRLKWPEKADEIDAAVQNSNSPLRMKPRGQFGQRMTYGNTGYYNRDDDSVMVVTFYYRVPKKFYSYLSKGGRNVNTWSKKDAEKNAKSKKDIAENDGYQVRQCIFSGDILFDEGEYPYQLNYYEGWLPMTAIVIAREENTGVPYGYVRPAKPDQKMYNRTMARMDWLQRCRQVIADSDAVDDIDGLAAELARPDAIILKRAGKELLIQKNLDEYQAHAARLPMFIANIERAMGIFNEATGEESNATSGKAIQLRKSGSDVTQAMPIDNLRAAKRSAGRKMAIMAQMKFTDQLLISVLGPDGKPEQVFANQPVMEDGKPKTDPDGNVVRDADVTQLDFDVFLEEAPDVATISEDQRDRLAQMYANGQRPDQLPPPALKALGFSEDTEIFKYAQQGFEQQIAQAKQALAENEKLKSELAKMQGIKIPGGAMPPAMPAGGVPGNIQ
jgi:hypothetical protein